MIIKQINYKNKNLSQHMDSKYNLKLHKHNIKSPLSDSRIFSNYLRKNLISSNKRSKLVLNVVKNKQILRLKKKLVYLKNKIKFSKIYSKFVRNSKKPKVPKKLITTKKPKFVLP